METEALKKALVDFLVEVVTEVKSRAVSSIAERAQSSPERDSILSERKNSASQGQPLPALPRFLSTSQAAQYWGTSTVGFRRMLERLFPEIPKGIVVRVGKRVRVDMRAFETWLVTKETNPRSTRG